jgi:hypothetical protein
MAKFGGEKAEFKEKFGKSGGEATKKNSLSVKMKGGSKMGDTASRTKGAHHKTNKSAKKY